MILKTIGVRGQGSYARLISYILRDDAIYRDESGEPVIIRHNVFGSPKDIEAQFKENSARRVHRKANTNDLLHTIIALSENDKERITPEMLEHLSKEYIRLLDPNGLYYGSLHMEGSPHAHILVHGCNLLGYSTRADLGKFQMIKQELQAIQMRDYPELTASIAEHGSRELAKTDAEYHMEQAGKTSRKQELKEMVGLAHELADSREQFYALLADDGLNTYERGGRVTGIQDDGKNYRFQTLEVNMEELDKRSERMNELQSLGENIEVVQDVEQGEEMTIEEQRMRELDYLGRF